MHIALISFEFPPLTAVGGIGSYMYHLSKVLAEDGNEVTVFSANPNGNKLQIENGIYYTNYQIPSVDNETFRNLILPVFSEFLKSKRVDLIECAEVGANALYVKEKFTHIPLIVKMHSPGVLVTKVSNFYLPFLHKIRYVAGALLRGRIDLGYWSKHDRNRDIDPEYRICMMADALLSPSEALKNWAISFWNIQEKKIEIAPNLFSYDEELFLFPLQDRPRVLSFIGKLSVLKGMKAFTLAIPLILESNPEYRIFLVGRDEIENGKSMKGWMQDRLAPYLSRIEFTGALNSTKLREIYSQSQICIFPSLWENYPTVILEAMASGAAITASKRGGIPEMIQNGGTGLLFNPKRPTDIAQKVNSLVFNEELRLKIAQNARRTMQNQLSNPTATKAIMSVYQRYKLKKNDQADN